MMVMPILPYEDFSESITVEGSLKISEPIATMKQ